MVDPASSMERYFLLLCWSEHNPLGMLERFDNARSRAFY